MQPAATILIVKSGISNHAASGILDELCLSKFGTFHAACPQPADNFRTYVQHLPCSRIKHNRAKPMFELASALFSIADVNEFRFARFYIVYEGVQLVRLKSPPIVCGCRTSFADCQNVERHGIRYQTRHRRNAPILLQRIPAAGWQSGTVQVQIFLNLCPPHSMPRSFKLLS